MTTAIITIAYGENYGNRLQNYALQAVLQELGTNPVTLRSLELVEGGVPGKILLFFNDMTRTILGKTVRWKWYKRKKRFAEFNRKYIQLSKEILGKNKAPKGLGDQYDCFIIGSDQVWNCDFSPISNNINNFLASFADGSKRIAYAASFGRSDIPQQYKPVFEKELPKFKAISVREVSGVAIAEHCGANATVVLDPTMLLTAQSWDRLAKKPSYVEKPGFIVSYFLGGRSKEMEEYIAKVADGRKIYNLENEETEEEQIKELDIYLTSPSEFVWLFSHADCILTDSFHGSVFSILYHKPFRVFDRIDNGVISGMESRINTLLETFHLEQCRGDINNPSGMPQSGDWDMVEQIIASERKKSIMFLKNAIELK